MVDQVSNYVQISGQVYELPAGDRVRLVYASRTASLVCVTDQIGQNLADGRLDGVDEQLLADLRRVEVIVPAGSDERTVVLDRQREESARTDFRRFILLPTTYCNMGCTYCGQEHTRGRLSADHRAAVVARVIAAIADPEVQHITVNWFGGEPMVGYPAVLDMSAKFIAAAAAQEVSYEAKMVTNASLLSLEKLRILHHECQISRFDITLDGPARIHDQHRPLKNGQRSFERITAMIGQALAEDDLASIQFVLRTNIDVRNVEWVDEYLETMSALGFGSDQVMFNLAPVYAWGNDVSALEIARLDFAQLEVKWMRRMFELGLRFVAVPDQTAGALCVGVTRSAEVSSSTGNIFSCSEYPLVPQHEATGGLGQLSLLPVQARRPVGPFDDWHDSIAAGATPCHSCFFLPVCGGACPKQWREGSAACPPYKFTLSERFDLMAEMNGLRPAALSAV